MPFFWIIKNNTVDFLLKEIPSLLTEYEQKQIASGIHPNLRSEKILARCIAKVILSVHLKKDPIRFNIEFKKSGKPMVYQKNICFNYSHSNGWYAFALDYDNEVGIDIEKIRPVIYENKVVDCYFSKEQQEAYNRASKTNKNQIFFSIWTEIEAYIKCIGASIFDHKIDGLNFNKLKKYSSIKNDIAFSICSSSSQANFIEKDIGFKNNLLQFCTHFRLTK